jgi:ribosomal protein S18 acetylase RimI-like enzyme
MGTANATVTVKAARVEDVAEIIDVLLAAFAPFAGQFAPTALRQTPDIVAGELPRWLVARRDGQVLGCVMHYAEDGYYTLCFLATRPEVRDQGLGSALVDAAIKAARAAGCCQVQIALRRSLHRNISFFSKRGFRYFAPFTTDTHDLYQLDLRAQQWQQ